ncbi:MAG: putative transcriptional regulator, MerR family [Actinomycetia bacterium]|nr:putative transcriptional regulator, MerR family [Actinomycetes bacterium]
MEPTWTIAELAEQATAILAAGSSVPASPANGRVRDMPNERLIRWYTTIGLVDPPLARRGRTALYGRRHLLQLVAVKRRQSAGRTIAEIQGELAGAPDETLRAIARLPDVVPEPESATAPHRERFWVAPPAAPAPIRAESRSAEGDGAAHPAVVHGVRLAPGVTLLLDGGKALGADELTALAAAARPLLDELHRRGLTSASPIPADRPVHDIPPGRST